ncbi:MAG: T9SS type A sorting domain-containing protein [Flavobacteriales bacterium]
MKNLLLSTLTICALAVNATGTEVTAPDMKLTIGNEWYMKVTGGTSIDDFTKTGTGATWDFTSYETSGTNDTVRVSAPTAGTTSTVSVVSNNITETNYQVTGSDILMTSLSGPSDDYEFTSAASSGFAHNSSSTWNSSTSIPSGFGNIPATISGSVIAEGTITTSYGNFDAVLVEETFDIPTLYSETFYFWETAEYGRIAILKDGKLSLMVQNNFSIITSTEKVTLNNLTIFPNPSTENFTVQADALENISVFDAIGNLVYNETVSNNSITVNTSGLNSGIYFVQSTANGETSTSRMIVK